MSMSEITLINFETLSFDGSTESKVPIENLAMMTSVVSEEFANFVPVK
jgi:hypothetical protein